jgi:hypothetical protein
VTHPGPEPIIYRTVGEHVNHYTTDTVQWVRQIWFVSAILNLGGPNQLQEEINSLIDW